MIFLQIYAANFDGVYPDDVHSNSSTDEIASHHELSSLETASQDMVDPTSAQQLSTKPKRDELEVLIETHLPHWDLNKLKKLILQHRFSKDDIPAIGELVKDRPNADIEKIIIALYWTPSNVRKTVIDFVKASTNGRPYSQIHQIIEKLEALSLSTIEKILSQIKREKDIRDADIFLLINSKGYDDGRSRPTRATDEDRAECLVLAKELLELKNAENNLSTLSDELAQIPYRKRQHIVNSVKELLPAYFLKTDIAILIHSLDRISNHAQIFDFITKCFEYVPNIKAHNIAHALSHLPPSQRESTMRSILEQAQAQHELIPYFLREDHILEMINERGQENYFRRLQARGNAAVNVHRAAAKHLSHLWERIKFDIVKLPLLTQDKAISLIQSWIDELTEEQALLFSCDKENITLHEIKENLHNFLKSNSFKKSFEMEFYLDHEQTTDENDNASNKISGEIMLLASVTYIQKNPDFKMAFLIQGLWSSITAYTQKSSKNIANISCYAGIAERLLLWLKSSEKADIRALIFRKIHHDEDFKNLYEQNTQDKLDELKEKFKKYLLENKYSEDEINAAFNDSNVVEVFTVHEESSSDSDVEIEADSSPASTL
jgi:hypothetical protein